MENIHTIGVLVRRQQDVLEGVRSAAGLLMNNIHTQIFVLGFDIQADSEMQAQLEWIDDLEGDLFSDIEANRSLGFDPLDLDEIGKRLRALDLIVAFGQR